MVTMIATMAIIIIKNKNDNNNENKHKNNDMPGPPPVHVNVMGMGGQPGYMPPEMMPHPGMPSMPPPGGMQMQVRTISRLCVPVVHV